jgi:hypothetical protein
MSGQNPGRGWNLTCATLAGLCVLALGAATAGQNGLARSQVGRRETTVGTLVKAELRKVAHITIPDPPSAPQVPGRSTSSNRPVAAEKGTALLVLRFELGPSDWALIDQRRLVVREKQVEGEGEKAGKTYTLGGWWVEDAQYEGGGGVATSVRGPWGNVFWSPVRIRPKAGGLALVFAVNEKATGLVFADGRSEIELDGLIR